MKLLDKWFGNKVKIVVAYKNASFMKFEQKFVFHKTTTRDIIKTSLKVKSYYPQTITTKRTKKFKSPEPGFYNTVTKEKCIYMYDD